MPVQKINIGAAPNDKTGDSLREAFALTNAAIDQVNANTEAIAGKVEKEAGKGLSTNDLTTTLLNKLNGVQASATNATLHGVGAATGPTVADLDALRAGGMYSATVAASTAAGLPVAVGHSVLHLPGSTGSAQQFASPITTAVANRRRVWHRQMIADGWSAWREIGFLDSPEFTGTPVAPNMRLTNVASTNSNTLDFYEEGAFAPTLEGATAAGSATYSYQGGSYTRIGNRVFWTARVTLSSFSGATGAIQLRGLPFVVANSSQDAGAVTIGFTANFAAASNIVDVSAIHNANAASATLYKLISGAQGHTSMGLSDLTNTTYLHLQGVYKAA